MNNNRSKKFTFRPPSNQSDAATKFKQPLAVSRNVDSFRGLHGFPRTNPYNKQGNFESPSKKLKFAANSELMEQIEDNFEGEMEGWDLDDDDFTKNLTIDDLNMLEVEASQQTEKRKKDVHESAALFNSTNNSKSQFPESLSHKSPFAANQPEKTLELFSNWKSMNATISNEDRKIEGFFDSRIKQLEKELSEYAQRVKQMEDAAIMKEGEVKMLRQGLDKTKEEKGKLAVKLQQVEGGALEKKNENEKLLQREIERLQTQLHFKDKEIMEAKEWRMKQENTRAELQSPKALLPSANRSRNSPVLSAVKSSPVVQNAIFQQNSFGSSHRPTVKSKLTTNQGTSTDTEYFCSCEKFNALSMRKDTFVHNEIDLVEEELLVMCTKQNCTVGAYNVYLQNNLPRNESAIGYQFIYNCVCQLRGKMSQNITNVLEVIERHLDLLLLEEAPKFPDCDLLCQENDHLLNEKLQEKETGGSSQFVHSIGNAALLVLMVLLKHCSFLQDCFLSSLNEEFDTLKSSCNNQEISVKNFGKNKYILAEKEFGHILILETDYSKRDENEGPNQGQCSTVLGRKTSNLDCHPGNLISKLFQTLSKLDQKLTNTIHKILVFLSASDSSISKSGLVYKIDEHKILGSLSRSLDSKSTIALLIILKNLSSESEFERVICYCPGDCPVRALYKTLAKKPDDWEISEWEQIKIEIIQTLLSVISSCPKAMKIMVASDCSHELVKSLVLMLFEEYKDIREDFELQIDNSRLEHSKKFLLLRHGMSLLAQISWNDKQFMDHRVEVEWQYLDLIYGTIRLFRRIPFINENEVIAVQDLRDIDQYEESDDWEERAHEPMDQN